MAGFDVIVGILVDNYIRKELKPESELEGPDM